MPAHWLFSQHSWTSSLPRRKKNGDQNSLKHAMSTLNLSSPSKQHQDESRKFVTLCNNLNNTMSYALVPNSGGATLTRQQSAALAKALGATLVSDHGSGGDTLMSASGTLPSGQSSGTAARGGNIFTRTLRRNSMRAKERVLSRLPSFIVKKSCAANYNDRTRDEQLSELILKIQHQQQLALRFAKELRCYALAVKALAFAGKNLNEIICGLTHKDGNVLDDIVWPRGDKQFTAATFAMEQFWIDYSDALNTTILQNVEIYLQQFPDLQARVAKRNRKLLDFDAARHELNALEATTNKRAADVASADKVRRARDIVCAARNAYEDLNEQLHVLLPRARDARVAFYANTLRDLAACERKFHNKIGGAYTDVLPSLNQLVEDVHTGQYGVSEPMLPSRKVSQKNSNSQNFMENNAPTPPPQAQRMYPQLPPTAPTPSTSASVQLQRRQQQSFSNNNAFEQDFKHYSLSDDGGEDENMSSVSRQRQRHHVEDDDDDDRSTLISKKSSSAAAARAAAKAAARKHGMLTPESSASSAASLSNAASTVSKKASLADASHVVESDAGLVARRRQKKSSDASSTTTPSSSSAHRRQRRHTVVLNSNHGQQQQQREDADNDDDDDEPSVADSNNSSKSRRKNSTSSKNNTPLASVVSSATATSSKSRRASMLVVPAAASHVSCVPSAKRHSSVVEIQQEQLLQASSPLPPPPPPVLPKRRLVVYENDGSDIDIGKSSLGSTPTNSEDEEVDETTENINNFRHSDTTIDLRSSIHALAEQENNFDDAASQKVVSYRRQPPPPPLSPEIPALPAKTSINRRKNSITAASSVVAGGGGGGRAASYVAAVSNNNSSSGKTSHSAPTANKAATMDRGADKNNKRGAAGGGTLPPSASGGDDSTANSNSSKLFASLVEQLKNRKLLYRVQATHAHRADNADELSFAKGDLIYVVEPNSETDQQRVAELDDGWQLGIKATSGTMGMFPQSFTRVLVASSAQ